MTKEQFREYVEKTIVETDTTSVASIEVAIEMIVAQWESDVNDARIAGQNAVSSVVLDHIDGLPDHPWIPGVMFADGKLLKTLRGE